MNKQTHDDDSPDRQMLTKLGSMYTLLDNYRCMFHDDDHPIRRALALDTFVYNIFKGREEQYSKLDYDANMCDMMEQLRSEEHISSITELQANEIQGMFKTPTANFKRVLATTESDVRRKKRQRREMYV